MSALLAVKRGKWALDVTWNFSVDIRQPTGDPQECRKVARILFSHVKRPTQGTPNIHIRWDVLKSTQQLLAIDQRCVAPKAGIIPRNQRNMHATRVVLSKYSQGLLTVHHVERRSQQSHLSPVR